MTTTMKQDSPSSNLSDQNSRTISSTVPPNAQAPDGSDDPKLQELLKEAEEIQQEVRQAEHLPDKKRRLWWHD